jgi:outer membrane autotransporter protein
LGWHDADTEIGTQLAGTSKANFDALQYGGSFEAGYRFAIGNAIAVEPVVGFSASLMDQESYDSSGGGAEDFFADSETTKNLRGLLALDFEYRPAAETPIQLKGRPGWRDEFADTHSQVQGSFRGDPDTALGGRGPKVARDSAILQAGFRAAITESLDFRFGYDGEINGDFQDHLVAGRLSFNF